MCLSSIYVQEEKDRRVVVEEASQVRAVGGEGIEVQTLFGERKQLEGYRIVEVNFLKNYLVLEKNVSLHGRK
jgi:predicted RNA-binding protein